LKKKNQASVIDGESVLVNVPSLARYAIHKIIVSQEKGIDAQVKKEKDLFQAHQLMSLLTTESPGDIHVVVESAVARGQRWKKPVFAESGELEKKMVCQFGSF
jgi:hypothetical protein